ncbi:MAG: L,D-transpeptidase family protein [Actinobacteria bacterium]|uniref:Unannotated protein n=1 Tax=freshwater metagenome TaxID=449393 RepID=A0A6J6PI46_9ZZZZ|nr:L,D-transpeptidase family protein [Actinomycetota bacterium]
MKALLALLLIGALLAPADPARARAVEAGERASRTVELDGVTVRLRPGTRQVVTARHTGGHHARITWWVLTGEGWQQRMQARDGRIGYAGLVAPRRRVQGSGTTPLGSYRLPWAFGRHPKSASWDFHYRRIRAGDYWVQDNASDFYNRYRNKAQGGFRWRLPASDPNASERLRDYHVQYEYSLVIGFNQEQVRHRGSGIFLHVNGAGATAGCVSAPRWFVKQLMVRLDRTREPVIAIGR